MNKLIKVIQLSLEEQKKIDKNKMKIQREKEELDENGGIENG